MPGCLFHFANEGWFNSVVNTYNYVMEEKENLEAHASVVIM